MIVNRIFIAFFLFGTLNNILYVVILSAAVDLVGAQTPKAIVLLADVLPAFFIKVLSPFFIHLIPYERRIWILIALSSVGMIVVSLSPSLGLKILGIVLASISSGFGEVTFLQLTHYFKESYSIFGFSLGTGGAGIAGSFLFMLLTNLLGIDVLTVLLLFSIAPFGFLVGFYVLLPSPVGGVYSALPQDQNLGDVEEEEEAEVEIDVEQSVGIIPALKISLLHDHLVLTVKAIKPLFYPYMVPLFTVYMSEYLINQGIAPVVLFPLEDLPSWLFSLYRDIYVVYGFLYQLGVFISRTSIRYVRIRKLYLLSILQFLNVIIMLSQAIFMNSPIGNIWILLILIFYEGLLGGFLYANTFMSVSEEVPKLNREFSMGTVVISDSFGIVIAGLISLWLEPNLCNLQVGNGRDWCKG